MRKRIVFINQSSGYLMIDIIRAFEGIYDERVLIAGSLKSRNRPLPDDVVFHKINAYDNSKKSKRVLSWLAAFIRIVWIVKTRYRDADLFLVSNPPLSMCIPFFCRNPFTFLVYDVYPDAITESGILKASSLPVRLWAYANQLVLAKAKRVVTISEGMKRCLEKYVDSTRIEVIPIWTDNAFFARIPKRSNFFIHDQALDGKFVVLYSGNIGYTHDVEVMVEIAEKVTQENIFFLIIGQGEKRDSIEKRITEKSLKNCRVLSLQPSEMLPYTFSSADLAVVTLSSFASNLSVPSKTYNYLSAGAPLLCVASDDSELADLVKKYDVGKCFSRNDLSGMVGFVTELQANPDYHTRLQNNTIRAAGDFTEENAMRFVANVR